MKNRNWRKGFVGVCLTLFAALVLAGCKGDEDPDANKPAKAPGENAPTKGKAGGDGAAPAQPSKE